LSLMRAADAVVGNSSSGLLEAPSLGKPTVNIGDRQKGRLEAESVLNARAERTAIARAIREALTRDCSRVINPYGDGHASSRILEVLLAVKEPRTLVRKRFIDIATA
jgi:UDP-N-acetylglucosamine 2-epimerase